MAIESRQFDQPDDVIDFGDKGRSDVVNVHDLLIVRSTLEPGWSWVEHVKPMTDGLESCPLHHHEYVVSGTIRYDMDEGASVEAGPGTFLDIEPGHLATVVGDEACVMVDFGEEWGEPEE